MKVCGIVCEYNPLHNGHVYHMSQARMETKCDYVICVMSGCFTQRGEPAIVDKWERTAFALRAGADLVIELPVAYAASSAQGFAEGAVGILDSLGVVTHLSFGAETSDLSLLQILAEIITREPESYKTTLKQHLDMGLSFPCARGKALSSVLLSSYGNDVPSADQCASMIESPNCILGIEYMRALALCGSSMQVVPVLRTGCGHNDDVLTGSYSSATSIRNALRSAPAANDAIFSVPDYVSEGIHRAMTNGAGPVFLDDFENLILAAFRKMSVCAIASLPDANEGLAYRLKRYAGASPSLQSMLEAVKSKRYTHTRLQRICIYALIGMVKEDLSRFKDVMQSGYARILGFRKESAPLLSAIKKHSGIPVISKAADYESVLNPVSQDMFRLDALSTDIYSLALKSPQKRAGGRDFTEQIIIV